MDKGDFFVHFMDLTEEELKRPVDDIVPSRLEALLELALRMSTANTDPFKDDLKVPVEQPSTAVVLWLPLLEAVRNSRLFSERFSLVINSRPTIQTKDASYLMAVFLFIFIYLSKTMNNIIYNKNIRQGRRVYINVLCVWFHDLFYQIFLS